MTKKAVVDAVYARLAANWTQCPIVALNTMGNVPANAAAFLAVDFPIAESRIFSVDGKDFREEGVARIVVYTDHGSGRDAAYSYAETISALFRLVTADGVNYLAPTIRDAVSDDLYFKLIVTIPYAFNYAG